MIPNRVCQTPAGSIDSKIKAYIDTRLHKPDKNIVNLSGEALNAKELGDGITKIYPNPLLKSFVFETIADNQYKTISIDVGNGYVNDINGVSFVDGSKITGISDSIGEDSTKALSQRAVISVKNEIDKETEERKAKDENLQLQIDNHEHTSGDITDIDDRIDSRCKHITKGDRGPPGESIKGDRGDRGYSSFEHYQFYNYGDVVEDELYDKYETRYNEYKDEAINTFNDEMFDEYLKRHFETYILTYRYKLYNEYHEKFTNDYPYFEDSTLFEFYQKYNYDDYITLEYYNEVVKRYDEYIELFKDETTATQTFENWQSENYGDVYIKSAIEKWETRHSQFVSDNIESFCFTPYDYYFHRESPVGEYVSSKEVKVYEERKTEYKPYSEW